MRPVVQEDNFGCGVACVAFLLGLSYSRTIKKFDNGSYKAKTKGFFLKDLNRALGMTYRLKYLGHKRLEYENFSIVFVRKSKRYPSGHYLVRYENRWMDPWINFPNPERKAGFRKRLPGSPSYLFRRGG